MKENVIKDFTFNNKTEDYVKLNFLKKFLRVVFVCPKKLVWFFIINLKVHQRC